MCLSEVSHVLGQCHLNPKPDFYSPPFYPYFAPVIFLLSLIVISLFPTIATPIPRDCFWYLHLTTPQIHIHLDIPSINIHLNPRGRPSIDFLRWQTY